jgi:hypothetical protein
MKTGPGEQHAWRHSLCFNSCTKPSVGKHRQLKKRRCRTKQGQVAKDGHCVQNTSDEAFQRVNYSFRVRQSVRNVTALPAQVACALQRWRRLMMHSTACQHT